MRRTLRKIKISTGKTIKVLKRTRLLNIPYQKKILEEYTYWIEFRIDEGRFWYGEIKPVFNLERNAYEIQNNYLMTKNGLQRSLKILDDIKERFEILSDDIDTDIIDIESPDVEMFDVFSRYRDEEEHKPKNEGVRLRGQFLN